MQEAKNPPISTPTSSFSSPRGSACQQLKIDEDDIRNSSELSPRGEAAGLWIDLV